MAGLCWVRLTRVAWLDLAGNSHLLVEIPALFDKILAQDLPLALDWRQQTRQLFTHYFARGYTVVDFHRENSGRSFYSLDLGGLIKCNALAAGKGFTRRLRNISA